MAQYARYFNDDGEIRWLPYLMYFHPPGYRSDVVNTDRYGFRITHGPHRTASVADPPVGPVRLLAGSSTVFGIGSTCDASTLPSRLWLTHAGTRPWLNFGGRSFNSTQELLLFVLYRHLLPDVEQVVLLSGFNNLGLARLPTTMQGDHGAFFNYGDYLRRLHRQRRFRRNAADPAEAPPSLAEQIDRAVTLTARHLQSWRLLTDALDARLTFVLQPLASWIRVEPAPQERALFAELDHLADFGRTYGQIASAEAGHAYSGALADACRDIGVEFLDLTGVLASAIDPDEWVFVDRIHFTDHGNDVVAGLLADHLRLD